MWITLFTLIALLLILALLAVGGFFLYVYWWLVQRPMPKLDGELILSILDEPVEILRDRHGVPHIYARSRADLFRAQGFVHAQDRLWQMEQNRRIAQGRLAELFGEAALDADRFSRIVGFWRAAQAELPTLDPEVLQVLTWYVEGVNAYIQSRPGRLAAECNLLRFTPEPWTPVDVLAFAKMMGWSLSINWESELTRLRLLKLLGPIRAAELEPDYPGENPIILEGLGSQEVTRLLNTGGLLLNEYEKLRQWLGTMEGGQGSNSWVLAPKRSLTRRPLLANDPHLAVQIPGAWYENHLSCPDLEVSGVSFAGGPGVVIGHNEHIAWGLTNACVDVQDLYVERPHPTDPTRFAHGEGWEQAQVIEEEIRIRRRTTPHVERVVVTRHGPLITGLLGDRAEVPLSLRWVGHGPGRLFRSLLRLNQARNWAEFQEALADWSVPAQNVTYADVEGNIGYVLAGQIPRREVNLGLVPAPGWDPTYEWDGYIPAEELPRLYNPPSGVIVTANNKMIGDDYPYFLGVEFFPGWRAARLEELLQKKERYTVRDMEEMQMDTVSKYAAALTPWLTLIDTEDSWERVAINYLRRWDFRMDTDSPAALIFHYTLLYLLQLTFGDKLGAAAEGYLGMATNPLFQINGFMLRAESRLVQLLNEAEESIWYMEAASGRPRRRDELLKEALGRAVRHIRRELGDNIRRWHWGRVHQVRYVHPLGSVRLLRGIFNRGPFPVGGDGVTPNQTRHAPKLPPGLVQIAASYRQVLEVGVWDQAQTVTATGQSGHPLSEHYDDQIPMWREGVYHKMPWQRAAVEKAAQYRLILQPGR